MAKRIKTPKGKKSTPKKSVQEKKTVKAKAKVKAQGNSLNPFRPGSHRNFFFTSLLAAKKSMSVDEITTMMKKQKHEVKRGTVSSWLAHLKREVPVVAVGSEVKDGKRLYRVTRK